MKILDRIIEKYLERQLGSGGIITLPNLPASIKGITFADYERLGYIYTCAEVRAENFASASLYVEDNQGNVKELEEVEEIAGLFTSLDMFSQFEFFYLSCMIRDLISSGVYYYVIRSSTGKPLSLFIIPPTVSVMVHYNPKNRFEILYYDINLGGNSIRVLPQDIINIRRPSFYNFQVGFSILKQYEEVIKTYLELTGFLYSQTTNSALPPKLVLRLDREVAPKIIEEMRNRWLERRDRILRGEDILVVMGELQQFGPSVQELDYVNTRRSYREEIRAAFRVPKILLGETDEINRATAEVSRRAFIENVINPLWRFYLSKINTFLKKEFNVTLTFDYIQSMPFDELARTLMPLYRDGIITLNEIREDLGYNRLVNGNKRQVALNMVMEDVEYEDIGRTRRPREKRAIKEPSFLAWARNNLIFEKGAKKLKPVIIRWFNEQEKEVLNRLNDMRRVFYRDLADNLLLDWERWIDEVKREWEAVIREIVSLASKRGAQLLDLDVISYDEFFVEQAILRGLRRIEDINEFTREILARQIREALMKNESIDDIANRIMAVFDGLRKWRAERIAWTESTQASNATLLAVFKRNGVEKKMWLSMRDERVRDTHKILDGQILKIDEFFLTIRGNKLLYPGDPSAPAGEVVNCRCSIVPV